MYNTENLFTYNLMTKNFKTMNSRFNYSKFSSWNILSNSIEWRDHMHFSNQLLLLCLFMTDGPASAPGSFLYSLRNNDGLAPFKATLINENDWYAITRKSSYGPVFGGGYDLRIVDYAASNIESSANPGNTYRLPPGYTYGQTNTKSLLAGGLFFTPSEVEVLNLN